MKKFTLPQNPHKGLKIFCRTCRIDNPKCKHYERQVYRVRFHIPDASSSVRTNFLEAENYNDAVAECVDFERELKANGYERTAVTFSETSTDYSIVDAIVKYREFMAGGDKAPRHRRSHLSDTDKSAVHIFLWKADRSIPACGGCKTFATN